MVISEIIRSIVVRNVTIILYSRETSEIRKNSFSFFFCFLFIYFFFFLSLFLPSVRAYEKISDAENFFFPFFFF